MKNQSQKQKLFDAEVFSSELLRAMRHDLGEIPLPSPYHKLFAKTQSEKLLKKFISKSSPEPDMKAYAKFLQSNTDMSRFCDLETKQFDRKTALVLIHARELCHRVLGPEVNAEDICLRARHSSGVTYGVPFSDTSVERKFTFPISSTAGAGKYWHVLKQCLPELWEAVAAYNRRNSSTVRELEIVPGSKLCTVPKTAAISRTISPEPTLNMFLQQGLSDLMWEKMERWGLSLANDQEIHRKMAYEGSITNRVGTIDFESASDRVSLGLLHYLLPRQWVAALMDLRCPAVKIKQQWVRMAMVSTMGNATTFPVETLVLWSLANASKYLTDQETRVEGVLSKGPLSLIPQFDRWCIIGVKAMSVRTFGDDVILTANACPLFIDVCRRLGMIPNDDKSFFAEEHFRESCGGDFFHGRDVRPLYLKGLPRSQFKKRDVEAYLYSVINGVVRTYIKYFGTLSYLYDKQALRFLFDRLNEVTDKVKFVPEYYPDTSGIAALQDLARIKNQYRFGISPIGIDEHGSLDFFYLKFEFPNESPRDDCIRYAILLKNWEVEEFPGDGRPPVVEVLEDVFLSNRIRMLGKYVQRRTRKEDRPHGYAFSATNQFLSSGRRGDRLAGMTYIYDRHGTTGLKNTRRNRKILDKGPVFVVTSCRRPA